MSDEVKKSKEQIEREIFDKKRHIGYIRVSSEEQSFDRQEFLLKESGVRIDMVKEEKKSGKNLTDRKVLKDILSWVGENDVLIVTEFSRLARSVQDLLDIVKQLNEKKTQIVSLKERFDTNTDYGRLMLTILTAVNEFERNIIRERQADGIKAAKERGVYKGRKKVVRQDFPFWYKSYINREVTVTSICKVLEISRTTFYRMVEEYEKENNIDRNKPDTLGFDVEKAKNDYDEFLDNLSESESKE